MPTVRISIVCLGLLCLAGCGPSQSALIDASTEPDAGLDLARARWIHAPVYADSATSVSSPDLAVTPSGELIAAWAENIGGSTIETQIFVGDGGPDFTSAARLAIPGTSMSGASLFANDDAITLVGSANAGATNSDIFLTRRNAGSWSPQINLTGPRDTNNFTDFDPEVFVFGNETIVLYRSSVFNPMVSNPLGIYMLRFTDPASPGVPTAILDREAFNCGGYEAAIDATGSIHIFADCTEGADANTMFYVTNKSGGFVSRSIAAPGFTSPFTPDIALSDGGETVHLLWVASGDCGGLSCRDVFYSRDLGPPVSVSGGEEDGGFFPNIAVDSNGRVIVVFHRLGNVDDVMWTYSELGSSFARVQKATPGTPDSVDSSVGNLVINPVTDRPNMVYNHSLPGVGGSNVFHGELVR